MKRVLILINLILCVLIQGCTENGPQPMPAAIAASLPLSDRMPTYLEMRERFRKQRKITVVYATGQAHLTDRYKAIGDSLQRRMGHYIDIEVKSDTALGKTDWDERGLMLLGTQTSNVILKRILPDLPLRLDDGQLQFDGQSYTTPSTMMLLPFYPNPLNNVLPISVVTGLEDEALVKFMERRLEMRWRIFAWSAWGYELYQENQRILLGHFDRKDWKLTREVHYDFTSGADNRFETNHFQFVVHGEEALKERTLKKAERMEQAIDLVATFVGKDFPKEKLTFNSYSTTQQKGLMLENTRHTHVDFKKKEIHDVNNEIYQEIDNGKANELLLRCLLEKPQTLALEEGLAVYLTEGWQRSGYSFWAAKLFQAGYRMPLEELLNERSRQGGSRLMYPCLSASFVAYLIDTYGQDLFLENYKNWEALPGELSRLQEEWYAHLASLPSSARSQSNAILPFIKGFNFAHEGYMGHNGYGTERSAKALRRTHELGSNTVAIIPYSYSRNPKKPGYLPVAGSAFDENDEGVIHSAAIGKERDMQIFLKPQIWVGGGSWPGDIEMSSEEDWTTWFGHYRRWMMHYAMLAEIHEMDVLCIGTELGKTTLKRPDNWRVLIRQLRKVFSGRLTYAANWGEEFEQMTFWKELDYIGLDCYYPLSKKEEVTKSELVNGFASTLKKIDKVCAKNKKSLIFTEIGFRSKEKPWIDPHAGHRREAYYGEHQRLCYEVVFEGLQNKSWCQGILWWKFPSFMEYDARPNGGFSPCGKPAEVVVEEWFGK